MPFVECHSRRSSADKASSSKVLPPVMSLGRHVGWGHFFQSDKVCLQQLLDEEERHTNERCCDIVWLYMFESFWMPMLKEAQVTGLGEAGVEHRIFFLSSSFLPPSFPFLCHRVDDT